MRSAEVKHLVAVCLVAAISALLLTGCPKKPEDYIVSEEEEKPNEPSSDIVVEIQSFGFMDVLSTGASPNPAPPEADTGEVAAAASAIEAVAADEGEGEGEEMPEEPGDYREFAAAAPGD